MCQEKQLVRQDQHQGPGRGVDPSLLGIGFLQQAGPKLLVVAERVHKKVPVGPDGQAIVNHHFYPLATLPELKER